MIHVGLKRGLARNLQLITWKEGIALFGSVPPFLVPFFWSIAFYPLGRPQDLLGMMASQNCPTFASWVVLVVLGPYGRDPCTKVNAILTVVLNASTQCTGLLDGRASGMIDSHHLAVCGVKQLAMRML
jgi:hypothetical protein